MNWLFLTLLVFSAFSKEEFVLTLNSKTLGQKTLLLTLEGKEEDMTRVSFSKEIARDNGQIISVDCLTSAIFPSLVKGKLEVVGENFKNEFHLDGSVGVSRFISDENENCQYEDLNDNLPLIIGGRSQYQYFNFNGYDLSVGLFTSSRVLTAKTRSPTRAEYEVSKLGFRTLLGKEQVRFSVTKTQNQSISFLEHGVASVRLCERSGTLDAQCGTASVSNSECHHRCIVTEDNLGCFYCKWD